MQPSSNELALRDNGEPRDNTLTVILSGLSPNTQRAYKRAILDYQHFIADRQLALCRESVQLYLSVGSTNGSTRSAQTTNQRLSAIKHLASEAANNNWIDRTIADGISTIPLLKHHGIRTGRWLTLDEAKKLLAGPDRTTAKGIRDLAVLALFLGTGIRRNELSTLKRENIK